MALNSIITPTWVGREVLRIASNKLKFAGKIEKFLSDEFKVGGAMVGATTNVRLPQRFTTTKGQALQQQGIADNIVAVTITDQANVAWGWSSQQASLSIQDTRKRYVNPAAVQIANTIDKDGLSRCYLEVANLEGTPGTVPNSNRTYLLGGARLTNMATPEGPRYVCINALMRVEIANANLALFNPQRDIGQVWKTGMFGSDVLGFDEWYEDVNVKTHTIGAQGGTPLVNGATQTGSSLLTKGWTASITGVVKKGDVFTMTAVNAVNPQSYDSTNQLQQFVATQDVNSDGGGLATIPIYPPLTTSGSQQTVTASPADSAAITMFGAASTATPQGLGFHPEFAILASVDLVMPNVGKAEIVRAPDLGLSLRLWQASDIMTDQHPSRLDVLYGYKVVRPEWAVRYAS